MRAAVHTSVLATSEGRAGAAPRSRNTSVARAATASSLTSGDGEVVLVISTVRADGFVADSDAGTRLQVVDGADSRASQVSLPAPHNSLGAGCRPLRAHICPSVHTRRML